MTHIDFAPSLSARILRPFYAFSGRTNRTGFWTVSITWAVIAEVMDVIWAKSGAAESQVGESKLVAAAVVLFAVPLLSLIAVGITRLHDRNKSGWWLLLFYLAPPVMQTFAALNDIDSAVMVWLMVISGVLTLWALVELGCRRGTAGPNRYGPMPPTSETL